MTILGNPRRCKWPDDPIAAIFIPHVHGIDLNPQDLRFPGSRQSITLMGSLAPAPLPGGYGVCEPPDPIPNSAVKPDSADGTIAQAMEE